MEAQNKTTVKQGTAQGGAGESQAAEANTQVERQSREIRDAYERAKRDMDEAVARLRREVNNIDVAQARARAEGWVKDNPTLAAFVAIGCGILVGKAVSSALTPPPPPSVPDRVRRRAGNYAANAWDYAEDISEAIAAGAALAGTAIAARAVDTGGKVAKRASQWGDVVADTAEDLGHEVRQRAGVAAKSIQHDAEDLTKSLKKKANRGLDFGETAVDAAKTIVAAVLVKKAAEWIKKVS